MSELNSVRSEFENTVKEEFTGSVIKDFLDKVSEIRKRLGSIRAMDDREIPIQPVRATELDEDGVETIVIYTIDEWLGKVKRKLLLMKDQEELSRRKIENREKLMVHETLKSIPRNKILPLYSRRIFLPW